MRRRAIFATFTALLAANGAFAAAGSGEGFGEGASARSEVRFVADMEYASPLKPASAAVDSARLARRVDSIVSGAIELGAFPGCQLFVTHRGRTLIDRAWGWHDYSRAVAVEPDHLYDLASVTKMVASTLALAKLTEQKKITLSDRLSKYYTPLAGTDKAAITFREVLTHRTGLPAGVALPWMMTRDSLLAAIRDARMRTRTYRYSDLPFLLVPEAVRAADGRDFETFLAEEFYRSLGISLVFNPLDKGVPLSRIVPTEDDDYWRHATVHGTVHDESAAVMGGVSGNAGLFGSARDLGAVMQMLQDGGESGGTRYLERATVELFTRQQRADNRRALGFDRPLPGNDTLPFEKAYPAPGASARSFGHTGFTGVIAWADPEAQLVYVLTCNSITPRRDNKAFVETRIRYAIQQAVYDAIGRPALKPAKLAATTAAAR